MVSVWLKFFSGGQGWWHLQNLLSLRKTFAFTHPVSRCCPKNWYDIPLGFRWCVHAPYEKFPYFPLVHVRTIRPRHTFFGLSQPSRAAAASFWCQRTRNEQGYHLGKWRGHTLWILRVTAVQSWSNFDQLFRGVFKRSSNKNTYRNKAFKDIFSNTAHSLWIWTIWRLKSDELPSPAQEKVWSEKESPTAPLHRKR